MKSENPFLVLSHFVYVLEAIISSVNERIAVTIKLREETENERMAVKLAGDNETYKQMVSEQHLGNVPVCVIAPSAVPWKRNGGCIDKMSEFCQGFFPVASAPESIKSKFTADERSASPACYLTINSIWPALGGMLSA